jgi:hypothetical protein
MTDDKAQIEEAAKSENNWVRARIIKQDLPYTRTLLQIAERARHMAANSLGPSILPMRGTYLIPESITILLSTRQ